MPNFQKTFAVASLTASVNQKSKQALEQLTGEHGYSLIPNVLLDLLRGHLKRNEHDVLMYIVRRTLCFHKLSDAISMSQFQNGIITREGKRLDYGCGIKSADTITRALRELEQLGFITRQHTVGANGVCTSNIYTICPEIITQTVTAAQVETAELTSIIQFPQTVPENNHLIEEGMTPSKTETYPSLERETPPAPQGDKIIVLQHNSFKLKTSHEAVVGSVNLKTTSQRVTEDTELLRKMGFEQSNAVHLATLAENYAKPADYVAGIIAYCAKKATTNPAGMVRRLIEQGEERQLHSKALKPALKLPPKNPSSKPFQKQVQPITPADPSRLWHETTQKIGQGLNQPELAIILANMQLEKVFERANKLVCQVNPQELWQKRMLTSASRSLIEMVLSQQLGTPAHLEFTK